MSELNLASLVKVVNFADAEGALPAALGQAAMAASLPVVIASNQSAVPVTPAAGELHLGEVGGRTVKVNSSFTRPSDTNAYAAGDALADSTSAPTVNTITNAARINAGSGVILNATLIDSAAVATAGSFEVWLFDTTWTPDNDNAVFTPTDAELATLVCIVPFNVSYVGDATVGADGNRVYQSDPINRGFVCGASSRNLFWALVVRNAFVPVSEEIFTLRLTILQD